MTHTSKAYAVVFVLLASLGAGEARADLLYTPSVFTGVEGVTFGSNRDPNSPYGYQIRPVTFNLGGVTSSFNHTFYLDINKNTYFDLTPGVVGDVVARFINNKGQVAGNYSNDLVDFNKFGFFQDNPLTSPSGTQPALFGGDETNVVGLNDLGQVLGNRGLLPSGAPNGFVFAGGKLTDLNNSLTDRTYLITRAVAINNLGFIQAQGFHGSNAVTILLSPVTPAAAPEPATLGAAAVGGLFGWLYLRRKSGRAHSPVTVPA